MTIIRIREELPGTPPQAGQNLSYIKLEDGISLTNVPPAPGLSARTPGATAISPIAIEPPLQKPYLLQSLGIQGYLVVTTIGQLYGKIGKLLGGLLLPQDQGTTQTTGPFGVPWTPTLLPQGDPSMMITLWDPDVDSLPPIYPQSGGNLTAQSPLSDYLPFSGLLQLPQSIELLPGQQPYIGLWQEPSLIGGFNPGGGNVPTWVIGVLFGTYVLTYDDGL